MSLCILAGGGRVKTWRVSDKKCVSTCATLTDWDQSCRVCPLFHSFFLPGQRSEGTLDRSHDWTERISRIFLGSSGLCSRGPLAAEQMAKAWLHCGVCFLLHAGGMLAGGADHCRRRGVGWRPGSWCDYDHPVCGSAHARCDLWCDGESKSGNFEVPAAGDHHPVHAAVCCSSVCWGSHGFTCSRVLLEPGADRHAFDQKPDGSRVQHILAGLFASGLFHRVFLRSYLSSNSTKPATQTCFDPSALDRCPSHILLLFR